MRERQRYLDDLVEFAWIERASRDLEPWADLIGYLATGLADEQTLWLIKLYNAFDDFGSAWNALSRWPTPQEWAGDAGIAQFPCTQERRGLRGGRVTMQLAHYLEFVRQAATQRAWLSGGIKYTTDQDNFDRMLPYLRRIWGVGRQTAYEWAEFLGKAGGFPLQAGDACLWESEGPRRSLIRLYGEPALSRTGLDAVGEKCRAYLAEHGVELEWWDFETVICDFNVMRDGRYYPGRHLAALREEIETVTNEIDRAELAEAFAAVIPAPWRDIQPGIDKAKLKVYRDTGRIVTTP